MWIAHGEISQGHSLMLSSMLDSEMTSSWWRRMRGAVSFIRTKITVCCRSLFVLLFLSVLFNGIVGMMSAAASLGLSLLWDTDVGLSHVDKYTYSSEEHIKVSKIILTSASISKSTVFFTLRQGPSSQQGFSTQVSAQKPTPPSLSSGITSPTNPSLSKLAP
jgi:hypothetical protein